MLHARSATLALAAAWCISSMSNSLLDTTATSKSHLPLGMEEQATQFSPLMRPTTKSAKGFAKVQEQSLVHHGILMLMLIGEFQKFQNWNRSTRALIKAASQAANIYRAPVQACKTQPSTSSTSPPAKHASRVLPTGVMKRRSCDPFAEALHHVLGAFHGRENT